MAYHQKDTTHVVIKFFEKSKTGQTSIDLVPVTWTYLQDGQLFCKYPNKSEYFKVNKLSKTSSEPGASWKSFKIILVKEARDYEQGIRRMKRGYSDAIIESSNIDECSDSSEKEEEPVQLTGNDLQRSLNKIPSLERNFKSTHKKYREDNSDTSVSDFTSNDEKSSVDNSDTSSSTSSLKTKETLKKHNRHDSQNAKSSLNSRSSTPPPKKQKTQSSMEKSVNSDSLQILSSETQDNATKTSAETQKSSIRSKVIDPKQKAKKKPDVSKTVMILSTSKKNKKNQTSSKKRYESCPTCGRTAPEFPSKSFLESMKRSIEYRIRDEAEKIRGTIAASSNSGYIEKIMEEGRIADLPKDDLNSFLQFEDDLKSDKDLVKKVKCFMMLNINSMRLSENLSIVIPCIITKNVQLLYSAFGRETNGVQKLNFSKTETYKYLREVILIKCPQVQLKELNSQLSRWFSGAKDREGGKKERNLKKTVKETEEN